MTLIVRIALAVALIAPASVAAQGFEIELGLRYEQLTLDGDFEFTCTCDPEEDPGCDTDPNFCSEGRLDEPHEGYLVGGFAGLHYSAKVWSAGFRMAATFGEFEPVDGGTNPETQSLFHITGEIPIEAHLRLPGTEVFAQVAPRMGFLNLGQDGASDESPDTVTLGVMLMAGVRFGGDTRVGAAAGRVQHPSISGWAYEAGVRFRAPDAVAPPLDDPALDDPATPAEVPATPAEVPAAPVAPEQPAVPDAPDGAAAPDGPAAPEPPPPS